MAAAKLTKCGDCVAWFKRRLGDTRGECRMNPPRVISKYDSAYPKVKATDAPCCCGKAMPGISRKTKAAPKAKGDDANAKSAE